MIKTEKISATQLVMLIVINRFLFGFSFMPTVTMAPANQDAWIAEIISGLLIVLIAIPMLIMANRFENMSFAEYFEVILGKHLGKIVCFVYALYLLVITLLTVILLSDFLLSSVLPETPMYAIIAFMIIPCIYASLKGLECIGRTSVLMSLFVFLVIILYAVLNTNHMNLMVFMPILHDSKWTQIAYGAFVNASRFCDCFLFFTFIPYVEKTKRYSITKAFIILVITFTILNLLITIATQASLGIGLARTLRYPYFISIQQISLFNIIERIEFFNVIGWIIIFFYKISSTILAASLIMEQIFNSKSYKPFVIPFNIILVGVSLMTSISYYPIMKKIFTEYAYIGIFIANFVIPLIVITVYIFRRNALKNIK